LNVLLISHCNFFGNSAMHVFSVATELQRLGHSCVVLVPDRAESVHEHRAPSFPVLTYADALASDALPFPDAQTADLIHAWSPREHVRTATLALSELTGAPYVVHMEDNEAYIVELETSGLSPAELGALPDSLTAELIGGYRTHPKRYPEFVAGAVGYTCLIEPLLEFRPEGVQGCVFWPGYDPEFGDVGDADLNLRAQHGVDDDELLILYSGNVHAANARDVERLYLAVLVAKRRGVKVRLLRTGWTYHPHPIAQAPEMQALVLDLGFVPRAELFRLISIADLLIQPGQGDRFNDYRVPSKLPEYLASGRPVATPSTNIGRHLSDGENAILLHDGSVGEMVGVIQQLAGDPDLRRHLGEGGRRFARERLSWAEAASRLDRLYRSAVQARPSPFTPAVDEPRFPVKIVAFYLPQFHPIPENDAWWGKGFTEWTGVVRAPPLFRGHDQPRLPTELGFYDLRVVETFFEQTRLARQYGVEAFCFYYYWFNGRRLLEKPLDLWLEQGPDFPFAICWANENWSRRWDGSDSEVLLANVWSPEDDERFILDVLPILKDPRYLRVRGAPVLHLYKVTDLPDPIGTAQTWRRVAAENGLPELHLVLIQSFGIGDPRPYGFDAAVEFSPPHVGRRLIDPEFLDDLAPDFTGYVEDYIGVAMESMERPPVDYVRYRGCFPRWDNTARRGTAAHIFVNESPKAYASWLRRLTGDALARRARQEPLVYVNAWNEWAEGAYLEPDETYGRAYLEATYAALCEGVRDHLLGPTPERERAFIEAVSSLPCGRPARPRSRQ